MKWVSGVLAVMLLGGLAWTLTVRAQEGVPGDYKLTTPSGPGEPRSISRLLTLARYLNDKLKKAGGENSPMCYRNCLTVALNEAQRCLDARGTFLATEPCEREAAWAIYRCNPECSGGTP